jgi:hypothetical protein
MFDYSERPVVEREELASNPTVRFLFGWMGIKRKGFRRLYFEDGRKFQSYPISSFIPAWSHILRGTVDVTGEYWREYNEGKPCHNAFELNGPFLAKEGAPSLSRITQYRRSGAPLPEGEDPRKWPKQYRKAWEAGAE